MSTVNRKAVAIGYWGLCFLLFSVIALRAALVPFSHDEVATFFYYIQSGRFIPFFAHPDANGHFLVNATSWICYKILGPSSFSLRLPVVLSFFVLCYGIWRMRAHFSHLLSWIVFAGSLLLSFNFLAFFVLCRGYGISMAFLVPALYYFLEAVRSRSQRPGAWCLFFLHAALAANLTLLPAVALLPAWFLFCFPKNTWRSKSVIVLPLLHIALIVYWAAYGVYLKNQGALYYGAGESYWSVTFESLIALIAGIHPLVVFVTVAAFIYLAVRVGTIIFRERWRAFLTPAVVVFATLILLIAGFYVMHLVVGMNFPEDRTGLFFYVFFILAIALVIDLPGRFHRQLFAAFPLFFAGHFLANMNVAVHPWPLYETIPPAFTERLLAEQSSRKQKITIEGHRVYEFFYGYLNYLHGGELNHCTAPETTQYDCDYAIASVRDSAGYSPLYEVIASEPYWGFRLLRSKQPLIREPLVHVDPVTSCEGNGEYFNALELTDTAFGGGSLQASFELEFEKVPVPFNGWLVLQVDPRDENSNSVLARVPLSLVRQNWNSAKVRLDVTGSEIPIRIKRLVAYLWNIDRKEVKFRFNSFHLYRLHR